MHFCPSLFSAFGLKPSLALLLFEFPPSAGCATGGYVTYRLCDAAELPRSAGQIPQAWRFGEARSR